MAAAKNEAERQVTIDEATAIDRPRIRPAGIYAEAIAAVKSEGVFAPERQDEPEKDGDSTGSNEFEREIEPETFTSPDLGGSKPADPISKPIVRKPQRGNFQRTRG